MKKVVTIMAIAFLLTGCGNANQVNNKEVVSNTNENQVVENNSNQETDKIELYSDDHKIVFKQVTGSYLVFYYEGNQITGYETYLDYEDSTTASVAVDIIKNDHENYQNVKSVSQKGQYVVVEYNENEYSAYSLDDVKSTYSLLEQVQKNS